MRAETQWFCFLAIDRGSLTPEQCVAILERTGLDAELLTVARAWVDGDSAADVAAVQRLIDDACARVAAGQVPPAFDIESAAVPATAGAEAHMAGSQGASGSFGILIRKDDLVTSDVNAVARLSAAATADVMRAMLAEVRARGGSDLHLCAGALPFMRIFGAIRFVGENRLSPEAALKLGTVLLDPDARDRFLRVKDLTLALSLPDGNRYRANFVLHREGLAATYHVVPDRIPSLAELGFEEDGVLAGLLENRNGLIIVAGPVGCGKTTTLAALVDRINHSRHEHVITIEDPIEILHVSDRALVTQREIGRHTHSYVSALKGALREDPDAIAVGELHDLQTTEIAITAAETGHLVLTTLHTQDAASTLTRLLNAFPPAQQPQIRAMASGSLRGIICQRLLPRADGRGQVAAYELLLNTSAVAKIIRDGATHHLPTVMQTGVSQGMRTLDNSILKLLAKGVITREVALEHLTSRKTIDRLAADTT